MYSIRKPEAKELDLPGRTVRVFIGTEKLSSDRMTIGMTEVPPESSMTPHTHEDMEEIFIIVKGKANVTVEKEEGALGQGDAVVIPAGAVHEMENIGSEDVEYVVVGISAGRDGATVLV